LQKIIVLQPIGQLIFNGPQEKEAQIHHSDSVLNEQVRFVNVVQMVKGSLT